MCKRLRYVQRAWLLGHTHVLLLPAVRLALVSNIKVTSYMTNRTATSEEAAAIQVSLKACSHTSNALSVMTYTCHATQAVYLQ